MDNSDVYILIVDDTRINQLLAAKGLEDDYPTLCVSNGYEALETIKKYPPTLILLDVMMPGMDGFEVAKRIRDNKKTKDIPIIFITAMTDKDSQMRGLELGAVDFISKPFDVAILRKRACNAVERELLRIKSNRQEEKLSILLQEQKIEKNTLESVFDASRDMLIVTQKNFEILRHNAKSKKILSDTNGVFSIKNFSEFSFFDEKNNKIHSESFLGVEKSTECILKTPSGSTLIVSVAAKFFVSGDGEINFLISIQDISALLALEQEKERSADLLFQAEMELKAQKVALDEHALVSITDLNGNIVYANKKFSDVSGYSNTELIGKNHRIIKSGLHPDSVYEEMWATIALGKIWHGEVANRSKNGQVYWVSSTIVPWLGKDGLPYRYISIRTDITERIRIQDELSKSRTRELEIGSNIQNKLLFGKIPSGLKGFEVECFSEASQGVDGDFYTFTKYDDSIFELFTGDVMGKGVTAALIGAGVKNSYRQCMAELYSQGGWRPNPAEIINAVHSSITPELIEIGAFVTLSLVRFDRERMTATWVNAGHTSTILSQDGNVVELNGNNLPLGVIREEIYEEKITEFSENDIFMFYSDGLPEASNKNDEQMGLDPFKSLIQNSHNDSAKIILDKIKEMVDSYSNDSLMGDDKTAIVVKISNGGT